MRASIELFGAFALIEAALWSHGHIISWSLAAAAWIAITTLAARRSPRELGITGRGFHESLWIPGAGAAASALIVLGGAVAGTLHVDSSGRHLAVRSLLYATWALAQQFILQSFFFVRFEQMLRSKWKAVLATGSLFVVAHVPNPVLLIAAAIAGIISPLLFSRYRNIYTLAIAHALVGLALAVAIPVSLHHQMKVGSGYYEHVVTPLIRKGREMSVAPRSGRAKELLALSACRGQRDRADAHPFQQFLKARVFSQRIGDGFGR